MHLTKGVALRLLVLLVLPAPAASSLHEAHLESQDGTCKQTNESPMMTGEHVPTGQEPVTEPSSEQEELVLLQLEHELRSPHRHLSEKSGAKVVHEKATHAKHSHSATLGRGAALLQAAIARTGMDAFSVILLVLLFVVVLTVCFAFLLTSSSHNKSDDRSGYSEIRDRRTWQRAEASSPAQDLLISPPGGTRPTPSPSMHQNYGRYQEAMSSELQRPIRSPLARSQVPAPDARQRRSDFPAASQIPAPDTTLKLPTDLVVTQSGGATFAFASGSARSQAKSGATRIPITNVATKEEVASLHLAEDEAGSGILFELSPDIPVAYLENWPGYTGGSRHVALFGAAMWDAMAAPAAIVKPMFSDFVMERGSEQILHISTNPQGQLKEVKDQHQRVVATFTPGSGSSPSLHIDRGADAGLILMATAACLDFLGPPGSATGI